MRARKLTNSHGMYGYHHLMIMVYCSLYKLIDNSEARNFVTAFGNFVTTFCCAYQLLFWVGSRILSMGFFQEINRPEFVLSHAKPCCLNQFDWLGGSTKPPGNPLVPPVILPAVICYLPNIDLQVYHITAGKSNIKHCNDTQCYFSLLLYNIKHQRFRSVMAQDGDLQGNLYTLEWG